MVWSGIDENLFTEVKQPKGTNPERQVYVDAATIERIIEIVPESEWKLLLSMSRYLGLRVPSEPFSLTWDCVDWERSRLKVLSPKTEVHGKSYRWVPILPEVRAHLDRVFAEAPEGAPHILHRLRERGSMKAAERGFWANMNLRKRLQDLIAKAGFQPWPKLWHNLRASAQTDLANRFPAHVVCEWLGNFEAVAKEHYLQVTDGHFRAALEEGPQAHQKAYQGERETALYAAQLDSGKAETPTKQGFHTRKVAGAGFEQLPLSKRKAGVKRQPDAESDVNGPRPTYDEYLERFLRIWDGMTPDERRELVESCERTAAAGLTAVE